MRRWIVLPIAALGLFVLRADMYPDGSNATTAAPPNLAGMVLGKSYGMVCTNQVDDTAALQAAADATAKASPIANSGGGILLLPPGICKVTAPVNITKSMIIAGSGGFEGAGNPGGTVIRTHNATQDVFNVVSGTQVIFRDFTIDIQGGVTKTSGTGIHIRGASAAAPNYHSIIERMRIRGMPNNLITENTFGETIRDSQFWDYKNNGFWRVGSADWPDGIWTYPVIVGNTFFPLNTQSTANAGIEINGAGIGWVTHNSFEVGQYGVLWAQRFGPTGTSIIAHNSLASHSSANVALTQPLENWAATGSFAAKVMTVTALTSGKILSGTYISGTGVPNGTQVLSQIADYTITGSISGTTLDVSAVTTGTVNIGSRLAAPTAGLVDGANGSTMVTAQLTGAAGGVGTYTVSIAQTVPSTTITGTKSDGGIGSYNTDTTLDLAGPLALTGENRAETNVITISDNKFSNRAVSPMSRNPIYIAPGKPHTAPNWTRGIVIADNNWNFNTTTGQPPAIINIQDGQGITLSGNEMNVSNIGTGNGISVGGAANNVRIGGGNQITRPQAGYSLFGPMNWDAVTVDRSPAPSLLFNGGMVVDQLNEGAALQFSQTYTPGGGAYCTDQWVVQLATTSGPPTNGQAAVCIQSTDAPVGSAYSLLTTITAAGATGPDDYMRIVQPVPTDTIAKLGYGTAGARETYLTYSIKSSVLGTFGVHLNNHINTRAFVGSCTVAVVNVWQKCGFSVPGDIVASWLLTGGTRAGNVEFVLAAGSTHNIAVPGTWYGNGPVLTLPAQTNLSETNGATFQLANVKWEIGDTPTPFLGRSYQEELVTLQRFYRKTFPTGVKPGSNAGIAGARCIKASNATAGTLGAFFAFDPPMSKTVPTIKTFNPSAANLNWRNVTANTDAVVDVDPAGAVSSTGVQVGQKTTTLNVGDNYCIHVTADSRI